MRYLIPYLFLVFLFSIFYAEATTEVAAEAKFILDGEEFRITLPEKYFNCKYKVRPRIKYGVIQIYNEYTALWVNGEGVWTDMPRACGTLTMRVYGMSRGGNSLSYIILDEVSGKSFELQGQKLWSKYLNSDYFYKLNYEIYESDLDDNTSIYNPPVSPSVDPIKKSSTIKPKVSLILILIPGAIFSGALVFKRFTLK